MEHCNYGDVRGIVGINCKHLFTVWYGPIKIDKLDFTYEENEEQYNKTQQQRYLENGVRKWKRKQAIAKKSEDEEGYKKASSKVREWQDRLKIFTEENNLKRDYTREHIKDYKNVTNHKENDIIIKEKRATRNAYAISQEQLDDICNNELKGIKFPQKPKYNPRIQDNGRTKYIDYPWGECKEITAIEIGKQDKKTKEFLLDSILHEKLEAKIASVNTDKYKTLKEMKDTGI